MSCRNDALDASANLDARARGQVQSLRTDDGTREACDEHSA